MGTGRISGRLNAEAIGRRSHRLEGYAFAAGDAAVDILAVLGGEVAGVGVHGGGGMGACERIFGNKDVLPLWVSDMDFPTAQPIIDAEKRRAAEGIWGYDAVTSSYKEEPSESKNKITEHLMRLYPRATAEDIEGIFGD